MRKAFCAWVEYKQLHYSVRAAKETVFLPKHLGHTEAAPPQSLSDSDTLTSAVLFTKLLLLPSHLRTESGGHAVETKLHTFTPSKKTSHVLWDVIENHDLA